MTHYYQSSGLRSTTSITQFISFTSVSKGDRWISLGFRAVNTVVPQAAPSAVKLPKRTATDVQGPKQFSVTDIETFSFFFWVWVFFLSPRKDCS